MSVQSDKKLTVLVVEDEKLLLEAITKKLSLNGVNVIACASGEAAVDHLSSTKILPDAIWLDYYLKDMNGLDFMEKVKSHSSWTKIPVVVVSNSASSEKVNSMMGMGVKKYILKAEHRLDEIINIVTQFGGAKA